MLRISRLLPRAAGLRWAGLLAAGLLAFGSAQPCGPLPAFDPDPAVVAYDPQHYPHLQCLAGRVIAESDPALSPGERQQLWQDYGLRPSFEWIEPADGFTYHELTLTQFGPLDYAACGLRRLWDRKAQALPSRRLPELITRMNSDPRLHWAAPDALLLEWADSGTDAATQPAEDTAEGTPLDADGAEAEPPAAPEDLVPPPDVTRAAEEDRKASGVTRDGEGVCFVDQNYKPLEGGLFAWAGETESQWQAPFPDFEYYRQCSPDGSPVDWDQRLATDPTFMSLCGQAYGTGAAAAEAGWEAAGRPPLSPVTICVADTGVLFSHPDLAGVLHPNSIDANYSNYKVAAPEERPGADLTIKDRNSRVGIGLPRDAIRRQPASHGTSVAGILKRCTGGYTTESGKPAVRLLPASIRSDKTYAMVGFSVKSPISAFIKLTYCLSHDFPVGKSSADPMGRIRNDGDVRVVSISASVPRAYFSKTEWKLVNPLVGKAASSIWQDISKNDRVYVFAAGNEAQSEPNRPCDEKYVIGVSACMPYDPSQAWVGPPPQLDSKGHPKWAREGSNLGLKCVAAPGYAVITSTIYPSPNLAYLPEEEMPKAWPDYSFPPRGAGWTQQTNRFCATSSATPQVGALAALLYAQQPGRSWSNVIAAIDESVAERHITASYGEARGLIDYRAALGWGLPEQ